jgi:hypothetical protein
MIRKSKGEFVVECECGEKMYGGTIEDFREFVDSIKEAGWRVEKAGNGEWIHDCPECVAGGM